MERARPRPRDGSRTCAVVGALDALINIAVFVAISLGFGIWSSWVMVENGSSLTTRTSGEWVLWSSAGRPDADPYTRAHFSRLGSLPLSTTAIHTWEARPTTRASDYIHRASTPCRATASPATGGASRCSTRRAS